MSYSSRRPNALQKTIATATAGLVLLMGSSGYLTQRRDVSQVTYVEKHTIWQTGSGAGLDTGVQQIGYLDINGNLSMSGSLATEAVTNCTNGLQTTATGMVICAANPPGITEAAADSRYVNTSGDTMTGELSIYKDAGTSTGNTLVVDTKGLVYNATDKRVGIGTTNPGSSIHVLESTPEIRFEDAEGGFSELIGAVGHMELSADQGNTQGGTRIDLTLDGTTRARMDSSGKLGIIDTSADAQLDVQTVNASTIGQIIQGSAAQSADLLQVLNSGGTELIVIDASGDVGINTNSPSGLLHINGTPGSLAQGLVFGDGDSGIYEIADDQISISTASAEQFRIKTTEIEFRGNDLVGAADGNFTGTVSGATLRASNFLVQRTATATDKNTVDEVIVGVTDTSVARTITLDTDDVIAGKMIIIKDESGAAGTNNITIDTEGAETIDGAVSVAITVNYGVGRFYSDGTNWFSF